MDKEKDRDEDKDEEKYKNKHKDVYWKQALGTRVSPLSELGLDYGSQYGQLALANHLTFNCENADLLQAVQTWTNIKI